MELIAEKDAWIWWNQTDDGLVKDVRVIDRQVALQNGRPPELGRYDLGASMAYWKEYPQPEVLFGELMFHGFTNNDEMRKALVEFATIVSAKWARRMIAEPMVNPMQELTVDEAREGRAKADKGDVSPGAVDHFLKRKGG